MNTLAESPVANAARLPVSRRHSEGKDISSAAAFLVLLGHAVYGLLVTRSAMIATVHAGVVFAIGLWIAISGSKRWIAVVCAYIAGCQILWRVGRASVPWEFSKYAVVLFILIAFMRTRRLRWDWSAVAYLALLLPSTVLAFGEYPFEYARQQVSFNMSGPLTLAMSAWFFSRSDLARGDVKLLFLAMLAPAVSLGSVSLLGTAQLEDVSFSDASNFQTSAGFGPNQVSTVLGLGLLLALLCGLLLSRSFRERTAYVAIAILLGVLSALTFSRGGLYSALGGLALASPFLLKSRQSRVAALAGAAFLIVVTEAVILPRLDSFTGGELVTRFQDTNPTGREVLILQELETFSSHPIFGVSPAALDQNDVGTVSTHTEFSRLLAQHGIFGVAALLLMMLLAWRAVASQRDDTGRALATALIVWSCITMVHAAMRLALVPFMFGLGAASFAPVWRGATFTTAPQGESDAN